MKEKILESTQNTFSNSLNFAKPNASQHVTYILVRAKHPRSSNLGIVFFLRGQTKVLVMTGTQLYVPSDSSQRENMTAPYANSPVSPPSENPWTCGVPTALVGFEFAIEFKRKNVIHYFCILFPSLLVL